MRTGTWAATWGWCGRAGMAMAMAMAVSASGGDPCKPAATYEGTYTVRQIRIDTPLQFLSGVAQQVEAIKAALPLKEKGSGEAGTFRVADYNAGIPVLRSQMGELRAWPDARIAGRFIAPPSLENCNDEQKTVDVVYRVYSLRVPMNLGHVAEGFGSQAGRALLPSGGTKALNRLKPRPFLGYDRVLRGYGGISASWRGVSKTVKEMEWLAMGSTSVRQLQFAMAGDRELAGPLAGVDWRVDFRNVRSPAGQAVLREGTLAAQFTAVTRTVGESAWVGRFGAALEGGYRQAEIEQALVAPGSIARAGTGAAKFFAGFSVQPGTVSMKGTYGIQLGKASEGLRLDYVKHIVDAELSGRVPGLRHRQFSFDLRLGAGLIQHRGLLPVGERFFGGNRVTPFIQGGSWEIRANPVMRSFPHNRMAQARADGYLGGDRFVALNQTFGYMVWNKPLTPTEVTSDPDFEKILGLALSASKSALFDSHLSETTGFQSIARELKPLEKQLADALAVLDRAKKKTTDEDLLDLLETVSEATKRRQENFANKPAEELDVRGLTMDVAADPSDPDDIPVDSLLKAIGKRWRSVEAEMADIPELSGELADLQRARGEVETVTATVQKKFSELEQSAAADEARALAGQEMRYSTRILNQLFREVNLIGISPVVFADVGAIRVNGQGGGLRYGTGGGVRLTFVSLELTAGYAWNIHPKPWEGRGAFVFSFDVANILR